MKRRAELSLMIVIGLLTPWVASLVIYLMSQELWWASLGVVILTIAFSALSLESLIHASIQNSAEGFKPTLAPHSTQAPQVQSNLDKFET